MQPFWAASLKHYNWYNPEGPLLVGGLLDLFKKLLLPFAIEQPQNT